MLNRYLQQRGRSAAWLADRLDISPSTVSRWTNGETRPRLQGIVIRIADVLNIYNAEERTTFFSAYSGFGGNLRISDEPGALSGQPSELANVTPIFPALSIPSASPGLSIPFLWQSVYVWWYGLVRWEDAPEHILSNWEGRVLFFMGSLTNRLKTGPVLTSLVALGLWISTGWMMTPLLRWPLGASAARFQASLTFALATLLIPLGLALIVYPLDYADFRPTSTREFLRVLFLKMAGAYTGFGVFASLMLFPVLVWHYFVGTPFSVALCWALTLLPLLFGYVAARRTPSDRFRMFHGELKAHEADSLFLAVGMLLGPFLASCIYLAYPTIQSGYFGFLLLLTAIGILIWEQRKASPAWLGDWGMVFVLGFLIPLAMFLTIALMPDPDIAPLYSLAPPFIFLIATYFFSETLLAITLSIRNPAILTLRGMLALLMIGLAALFVLKWDLLAGRIFVLLLIALWVGWGRERFRHSFWVHPAFALLQTAFILSILAIIRTDFSPLLNGLIFLCIAVGAIGWAYQRKS